MKRSDVIEYFGGTQTKAALALGVTKSAVSQWPDIVPERIAFRAQELSAGVLAVDPVVYARRDKQIARRRRPRAA